MGKAIDPDKTEHVEYVVDIEFLPLRRCVQCGTPFPPSAEQDDWCGQDCYERWLERQGECGE